MATSWLFRAIFASSLGAGISACTLLTGVGDLSVEAGDPDAAPEASADAANIAPAIDSAGNDVVDAGDLDAPLLSDAPITTIDACSTTGCLPVPAGFVYVALGPNGADCPDGFINPVDVIDGETVDPTACSCGCDVTNAGRCPASGQIVDLVSAVDGGATCPQELGTLNAAGCAVDGYMGPFEATRYRKYVPPPSATPVGLACAGNTNKDATRVGGTAVRLCEATVVPACNTLVCPTDPGGGFQSCIAPSNGGAQTCPPEWPVSHSVGTGISFDCDGTACGCSAITGQCTGGELAFYASSNCTGNAGFLAPVDSSCERSLTADGTTVYGSHLYTPNPPANVKCVASGAANVVNTVIAQASTVCCTN